MAGLGQSRGGPGWAPGRGSAVRAPGQACLQALASLPPLPLSWEGSESSLHPSSPSARGHSTRLLASRPPCPSLSGSQLCSGQLLPQLPSFLCSGLSSPGAPPSPKPFPCLRQCPFPLFRSGTKPFFHAACHDSGPKFYLPSLLHPALLYSPVYTLLSFPVSLP